MQALAARLRIALALVFLAIAAIGYPAAAQAANSVDPTKDAVSEQQLLQRVQDGSVVSAPFPIRNPIRSSSRPAATGAISTK